MHSRIHNVEVIDAEHVTTDTLQGAEIKPVGVFHEISQHEPPVAMKYLTKTRMTMMKMHKPSHHSTSPFYQ